MTKTIACGQCGLVQSMSSNRQTRVGKGLSWRDLESMVQTQCVQMAWSGEPSRLPTWAQLTSKINLCYPPIKTLKRWSILLEITLLQVELDSSLNLGSIKTH
jgi:hypothetical protein